MPAPSETKIEQLIRARPPARALRWVERAAGGEVVAVRPLPSWSTAMHSLDVERDSGRRERLVLRRYVRHGLPAEERHHRPGREAELLALLEASGVPAPRPIASDPHGGECDAPALLMSRVPGRPRFRPRDLPSFVDALAATLAPIHGVGSTARDLVPSYRPYRDAAELRPPDWTRDAAVWERAAALVEHLPQTGSPCLIHRDYHPGNVHWLDRRITGILDWPTASWGPPGIDVAHMRHNLVLNNSIEAADAFLERCRAHIGDEPAQPVWDLRTALDGVPDPADRGGLPPARALARFETYIERLVAAAG